MIAHTFGGRFAVAINHIQPQRSPQSLDEMSSSQMFKRPVERLETVAARLLVELSGALVRSH